MKFYNTQLSNGLNVIGEHNPFAKSVAIGFFVKTGARDEAPEVSGVSHFLEHMMFKGTAKRTALDVTYDLGKIGAQANAYTSEETTVYYMQVLPEYLEQALEILSDMLKPSLLQEDFEVEKNVILEEIALYQDRPSHILFEASLAEFFKGHCAGNSVLGTTDSIKKLKLEQMKEYFAKRYCASNMVFCISGNFDWDMVVSRIGDFCGHWEKGDAKREIISHQPVPSKLELKKDNLNMPQMCFMASGPDVGDDLKYEVSLLANILGDSTGSKLYWSLIDSGIAESAYVSCDDMDGVGIIYAFLSASKDNLSKAKKILCENLDNPIFDESDVELAKTKIKTRLVLQSESTMRRLMAVGNTWLNESKYVALVDHLNRIDKISKSSITKTLEKYPFRAVVEVQIS